MLRRTETSGRNSLGTTKADEALFDVVLDVSCRSRKSQLCALEFEENVRGEGDAP